MRSVSIVLAVLFYSVCVSAEPDNAHYATDMGTEPDYSAPYAEYSADDPLGEFDIERAAQFVDGVAVKWGVKHDCVTCHTNGHYLMVPPKLFRHRPAAKDVLAFAEGWIDSWEEKGLPRTEIVVGPTAFLTINNMQMDGRLRPATRNALDEVWRLQSEEGHWEDWLKCEWPPFEQDDHYGVTLLTIAMGMAPESYTSVEPAQTGIRRMLDYLQRYAPEEVHHRAMMLWAGKYFDDLVSAGEREHWIDELLKLQKTSGGWASGDLGRWRQRAPETGGYSHLDPKFVEREYPLVMIDPNGDGYGTGFVLYVLLQAGVPVSHDQIQQGLAWLRQNQQADGKWFTNSLRNETDTSNFLTHTGTIFALMALAETM